MIFASTRKFQWSFNFLQKQHVLEKSGSWVMIQNLKANQNAGFFKLVKNKLK